MTVELQGQTGPRITVRDLEILDFVARLGVASGGAVARWAGTGHSVSYRREARWKRAGFVEVLPPIGDSGRLLRCTRRGLTALGRQELRPTRVSLGLLPHLVTVGWVAAELERRDSSLWTEREVLAIEAQHGRPILSARLPDGRSHRPDLVVRDGPTAIEVELTQKSRARLDANLRAWRRAIGRGTFAEVRYLCGEHVLTAVERARKRTATEELIEIEPLPRPELATPWRAR